MRKLDREYMRGATKHSPPKLALINNKIMPELAIAQTKSDATPPNTEKQEDKSNRI